MITSSSIYMLNRNARRTPHLTADVNNHEAPRSASAIADAQRSSIGGLLRTASRDVLRAH